MHTTMKFSLRCSVLIISPPLPPNHNNNEGEQQYNLGHQTQTKPRKNPGYMDRRNYQPGPVSRGLPPYSSLSPPFLILFNC